MRPSSLVGAPGPERTRPFTTFALDVALYGTVALCATRLGVPTYRQDHVPVERRAIPAGIETGDGHIARELAMEGRHLLGLDGARGVGRAVVVDHSAGDGQETISGVEQLDQARLAWPVDQRGGRHLPEPAAVPARVRTGPDRVGVDVAVEPQNDVARRVHALDHFARVDVSRPAGSALVAHRVERVM